MAEVIRIQVLVPEPEAKRFSSYCREKGFKKSPLIARLIREHLQQEGFHIQADLFDTEKQDPPELWPTR